MISVTLLLINFFFFVFQKKKLLIVNEALDLLEELDDVKDLYIEPPDISNLTDEDSGPEDEGTVFHPESLSRNQLLAPAELRASHHEEEDKEDEESLVEQNKTRKKPIRKKHKLSETSAKIKWGKNKGTAAQAGISPEVNCSKYGVYNFVELFELFFDEEILAHTKECDKILFDEKLT